MTHFTLYAFGTASGMKYSVTDNCAFPEAGFVYSCIRIARRVCAELNGALGATEKD